MYLRNLHYLFEECNCFIAPSKIHFYMARINLKYERAAREN